MSDTSNHLVMENEYHNELTADLDTHLKKQWKKLLQYSGGSYFYLESSIDGYILKKENPSVYYVAFRHPGATRGCIGIDKETAQIVAFEFYETAYEQDGIACYDPSVVDVRSKWMGRCLPDLLQMIKSRSNS